MSKAKKLLDCNNEELSTDNAHFDKRVNKFLNSPDFGKNAPKVIQALDETIKFIGKALKSVEDRDAKLMFAEVSVLLVEALAEIEKKFVITKV